MTVVAETGWDLPLLLHVAGAMVMVGALIVAVAALVMASRGNSAAATRLGYRALLLGVLPAWLVMRVAAQFALDDSGYDEEAAWVGIGFMTSEGGLLLIIIATVLAGLAARRDQGDGPATKVRVAAGLCGFLIALSVVAVWAMTTKPD